MRALGGLTVTLAGPPRGPGQASRSGVPLLRAPSLPPPAPTPTHRPVALSRPARLPAPTAPAPRPPVLRRPLPLPSQPAAPDRFPTTTRPDSPPHPAFARSTTTRAPGRALGEPQDIPRSPRQRRPRSWRRPGASFLAAAGIAVLAPPGLQALVHTPKKVLGFRVFARVAMMSGPWRCETG